MDAKTREAKRKASRDANQARRAKLECSSVLLKIQSKRLRPSQLEAIERLFLETKWFYNHSLATGNTNYKLTTVQTKTPNGFETRTITSGSRIRQAALKDLETAKKALAASKRNGRKIGGLHYKSRCNSVGLLTYGQSHYLKGNKLKITGVPGVVSIHGLKQIEDRELGGARLVRKPSGFYIRLTTWRKPKSEKPNLPPIGIDMGIKTHITLSDGREWNTVVKETERLKRLQRKLSRQQKGSNRYWNTRNAIQREYEKLNNKKDEAANQLVSQLKQHKVVAFQDENLRAWKRKRGTKRGYGRTIQSSSLGRVKAKLSTLDQAVMLDKWEPTTQYCPNCSSLNKHSLSQRVYSCACGYSMDRDVHAARNMLVLSNSLSPQELGDALVEPTTAAELEEKSTSKVSSGVEARNRYSEKGGLLVGAGEVRRNGTRLQRCP